MALAPNPLLSLLEALNFAAIKHRDQRRKDPSKTPYINHPIGVAHILATEGGVSDLATLQVQTWATLCFIRSGYVKLWYGTVQYVA